MAKKDLIRNLADKTGLTQSNIGAVLDAINAEAKVSLSATGEFDIHGLVTLKKVHRNDRKGRNPKTGESITLAAKDTVTAKPAGAIKNMFS